MARSAFDDTLQLVFRLSQGPLRCKARIVILGLHLSLSGGEEKSKPSISDSGSGRMMDRAGRRQTGPKLLSPGPLCISLPCGVAKALGRMEADRLAQIPDECSARAKFIEATRLKRLRGLQGVSCVGSASRKSITGLSHRLCVCWDDGSVLCNVAPKAKPRRASMISCARSRLP
jgi:hypothetical protein